MACWATGEPANITEQQDHRRKYRAAVSWTDFNAGRILDTIEEQGFANDTAVIFNGAFCSAGALRSWLDGGTDSNARAAGDHGWHLGEHDLWCKMTNREVCVRPSGPPPRP